jgi:hypothetical protein
MRLVLRQYVRDTFCKDHLARTKARDTKRREFNRLVKQAQTAGLVGATNGKSDANMWLMAKGRQSLRSSGFGVDINSKGPWGPEKGNFEDAIRLQ